MSTQSITTAPSDKNFIKTDPDLMMIVVMISYNRHIHSTKVKIKGEKKTQQ